MDILKLSFLCHLFPLLTKAANICPQFLCGTNYVVVRYPFQFKDDVQQPAGGNNCSYPGFNLSCNHQGQVVLNLPNSGDFYVRSIDYRAQVIQLYDPSRCLAGRLLGLNLSGSPFEHSYTRNYTYLSCPLRATLGLPARIHCLSNFSTWTIATLSTSLVTELTNQNICQMIAVVRVPVMKLVQHDKEISSTLSEDLYLTWNMPNCKDCEARRGACGFSNSSKPDTLCNGATGLNNVNWINRPLVYDSLVYLPDPCQQDYNTSLTGGTGTGSLQLLKIIALSIALPAMTCSIVITCFICVCERRRANRNNRQQNLTLGAITPAETPNVTLGLDESTIESYTKVVLGESMRVPGLNDVTCPICLSNYNAKETVRCIPECKHCFHAECIDEWLRLNGTCPVCRSSPSHAHS